MCQSREVADLKPVLADLQAESEDLDALVADLPDEAWAGATPAPGWTIAHQIAHLAWTDRAAHLAITDPPRSRTSCSVRSRPSTPTSTRRPPRWPNNPPHSCCCSGARAVPADRGAAVVCPEHEDRLVRAADERDVDGHRAADGDLGARAGRRRRARRHAPADRPAAARRAHRRAHPRLRLPRPRPDAAGRAVPRRAHRAGRLDLDLGPEDATQRVTGPALDFCLLVTQRRHRDDLALVADGPDADEWLDIAQAFAGPPGAGREPGAFSAKSG